ncbi:hypothetical protein ACVWXQ_009405 [Bradyrhizobium sp. S3.14.4]
MTSAIEPKLIGGIDEMPLKRPSPSTLPNRKPIARPQATVESDRKWP